MDFRFTIIFVLCILTAVVLSMPSESEREKRDVVESMKNAWTEMVRTLSDAGDAVVHVFKPTEKSTIDKVADGIKNIGQ